MTMRRLVPLAVSLMLGLSPIVACAPSADDTLVGIVRDEPLDVGQVAVTDVTAEGLYADHEPMFTMKARAGRLLVVYFGYTNCPDLCPTTLAALRGARSVIGADGDRFDVAMVTVDPARDTAEVLNGYLASFGDLFHALRPVSDDELASAEEPFLASSSVVTSDDGKVEVGHSATAYVVDDDGIVLVEWPFGITKDGMAHDLKILLNKTGEKER